MLRLSIMTNIEYLTYKTINKNMTLKIPSNIIPGNVEYFCKIYLYKKILSAYKHNNFLNKTNV